MTVSVIVPVYKDQWFLQCVESIEAQTYKDIDLIIIDDSDRTGAWATRNRGLDEATGEFIAFCDADDYLEPDAIERMVEDIEGVDLVVGSFRKFGAYDQVVTKDSTEVLTAKQVAEYAMSNLKSPRKNQLLSGCWAKLYRRSLVGRFPDLTTAEDMAFNFDYLTRCKKVRFSSGVVYNNRKHNGSLSTTFDESNKPGLFGFLEGLSYVKRFLGEFYSEDEIDKAVDNSKVYHSMLYFMRICDQTKNPQKDVFMKLYP